MKQIEIKTHEKIEYEVGEKLTTKHLIKMIIDKIPAGGFTLKDIQDRNKIEQAIKDTKEGFPILLEDSEFDALHNLAKGMQWPVRDMFIADFVEGLKDIKSVKPADLQELKNSENGKATELKTA
jgi:hypothetical protein